MNPPFSIGLAGGISSGKSTLSHDLADRLDLRRIGFGDFVRAEAERLELATTRRALQALGAERLEALGPEEFCRAAADAAHIDLQSTGVIWDGVRHLDIVEAIGGLQAPRRCYLIGLQPPEASRQHRADSEAGSPAEREIWERDSTERELAAVLAAADFIVEAATAEDALREALAWIADRPTDQSAGRRGDA